MFYTHLISHLSPFTILIAESSARTNDRKASEVQDALLWHGLWIQWIWKKGRSCRSCVISSLYHFIHTCSGIPENNCIATETYGWSAVPQRQMFLMIKRSRLAGKRVKGDIEAWSHGSHGNIHLMQKEKSTEPFCTQTCPGWLLAIDHIPKATIPCRIYRINQVRGKNFCFTKKSLV